MEVRAELSSGNLRAGTDSREPREGSGAVESSHSKRPISLF